MKHASRAIHKPKRIRCHTRTTHVGVSKSPEDILARADLRRTDERLRVLEVLMHRSTPSSVEDLGALVGPTVHKVTLYRMLEQFAERGIVARLQFGDDKRWYEYQTIHHHHITCSTCGKRTPVYVHERALLRGVLRSAPDFKHVESHTVEFVGVCTSCTA